LCIKKALDPIFGDAVAQEVQNHRLDLTRSFGRSHAIARAQLRVIQGADRACT
jgi:hypothetical protein